nr:tRNA pseudouridine(38-40) synthase TruA [Methylonatrum kenyense]
MALGIEYDGGRYAGWQHQRHATSVQEMLEAALSRVADHRVAVTCAGRTDAGVHAVGQVVHFDTDAQRDLHGWLLGVTSNLPDDIAVTWVRQVPADFDARFSATGRCYRYVILSRPTRPGLLHGRVSWIWKQLDAKVMQRAGAALVGEHDFTSYRAIGCQARHARRCITRLQVTADGPFIYLDVAANAFLHHMVRNIAGVLMTIGAGEAAPEWAAQVLAARDRTAGGVTAPAAGLYMVAVDYPQRFGLPPAPPPPVFASSQGPG